MLLALAAACAATGPGAQVVDEGGIVPLPSDLAAAWTEDAEVEPGEGHGWLLLTADPLDCEAVAAFPTAPLDEDHPWFTTSGLAFELVYETVDEVTTWMAWEGTYWVGEVDPASGTLVGGAVSPLGWRAVGPWVFGDGAAYRLSAGWLALDRHGEREVEGRFAVTGYEGDFVAEHCGTWN